MLVLNPIPFLQGRLTQQYPMPKVIRDERTQVLNHSTPTWDNLFSLIDLCAGFGGLSQGAIAAGWEVAVAVDHSPKMVGLYTQVNDAPAICGDFGDLSVLHDVWKRSQGARALSSGFSCQPYSRLGDGRSFQDERSSCLPKTLNAAFLLQSWIVVLECVSPAGTDAYVKAELEKFVQCTNFTCAQVDLKLDQVWPCRRHRTWWVLTSPQIGPITLQNWPSFTNVTEVRQVLPFMQLWSPDDEMALELDSTEMQAFGV